MSDIFISYARSTAEQARQVAEALRALGHGVWLDDELPAHRGYAEVIEERLRSAKAVVVIWSAEAVKSEWVQSEADRAREDRKLVQLSVDGARLPMPFDRIQCADLASWTGDTEAPGWRKVVASIEELIRGPTTASAVAAEAPLALPDKPSIAVLPFANLSGDLEQDYFADGMVVEIVAALSLAKSIFVIASGSSLTFKGKGLSPREVARQLGVRYVLEGSVRKAGGRVRIAVQLIDAEDGAQIWTHRFEDTLEDVFALQDRVALGAAGAIEPGVEAAEIRRAVKRPTKDVGSYDLYLRAMSSFITYGKAGVLEALVLLDRAIALDPNFATALGVAANCHYMAVFFGWSVDPANDRLRAIELAHRALRASGDDARVLTTTALILADLEQDLDGAVAQIDRGLALNPGSSLAWTFSGAIRMRTGQVDLGAEHLETALRLDPVGNTRISTMGFLGMLRYQQGRLAEAVALSRAYVQQTDSPLGWAWLAASYGRLGQTAAAREALTTYRTLAPQPIEVMAGFILRNPAQLKLFLDGIALAEGESPLDVAGAVAPT